jgi:hypothetical protein
MEPEGVSVVKERVEEVAVFERSPEQKTDYSGI